MTSTKELSLEEYLETANENMCSKPKISQDKAVELMKKLYGLQVTEIKDLNSFADQNFYVKVLEDHDNPYIEQVCCDGYTLKIINTLKSSIEGHFDSMHTAVNRLNQKGLRVPVPVKNLAGKTWQMEYAPLFRKGKHSTDSSEKKCGVYLYTYIPGKPLANIEYTPEILFQWGELLAKFHKALEDLECLDLRNKVIMSNLKFIHFCENYMGSMDENEKKLVNAVLERYPTEVAENINSLPEGFIHGDFNDHNVLAQIKESAGGKKYVADGIVDFEDIHHGAYAWDIGLMLSHASLIPNWPDPLEAAGITLAGYLSIRTLNELELSMLKICVECRVIQTLVFCSHCASLDPENAYISNLTLSDSKCELLRLLQKTTNEELLQKWNNIYKKYLFN